MKMRRDIAIATALFAITVILLAFGLSLVDVSRLLATIVPYSSQRIEQQALSMAYVFVDPKTMIGDYLLDPGYRIGDKIQVHINASSVVDLYTYHIHLSWNPAMLNFSRIVSYGDFLNRTTSAYGTSRAVEIKNVDNGTGHAVFAESVLGEFPGISGAGRLLTIEFSIASYGSTTIDINSIADLPTSLLNSTGDNIAYTPESSVFRNTLRGDANGDKIVDVLDAATISAHWYPGPPVGPSGYDPVYDMSGDGRIDILDAAVVSANWNRTLP